MGKFATLTADLPPELRKAHPICVAKKVYKWGYKPVEAPKDVRERAARECIEEGHLHGVIKLLLGE